MYTRANIRLAEIGLAAGPGGWPAGGGGCARQDKLVQAVLSEHADLGALHGSRGQPRQPAIRGRTAQPTMAKMSGKREQGKALPCVQTATAGRPTSTIQDCPGAEALIADSA